MELRQIRLDNLRSISRRIARNEDVLHDTLAVLLFNLVDHAGHLVQLLGADIRAVREAEVDERVFALQIFLCEVLAVVVGKVESAADKRLSNALILCGDTGACHAGLFVAEVEGQTSAGDKEEEACLP